MSDNDTPGPNPPFRVGAPTPPPSLGELMMWHAYMGTLQSFLISIGYYYSHPTETDRQNSRERGRGR
jgi:hypothetical protein